jgi:hypothetical protein
MKAAVSIAVLVCTLPVCAQDLAALTGETRTTVLPVIPKVIAAMQEAVATEGVAGAIPVCKDLAPQLIGNKRAETGWDIRRVSLKTRNAERGTPDAWEAVHPSSTKMRLSDCLCAIPGCGIGTTGVWRRALAGRRLRTAPSVGG